MNNMKVLATIGLFYSSKDWILLMTGNFFFLGTGVVYGRCYIYDYF